MPRAAKSRTKAGGSQTAAVARRKAFAAAYIANGRNATQAAITAGYSAKTAGAAGARLLKHVQVSTQIEQVVAPIAENIGLTAERALKRLERVAFYDARKLYDDKGKPKSIHELDDDTAAAVSGVGPHGFQTHDSLKALDMTFRHLGLYEKDNAQRAENLAIQIVTVGPK